MRDDRHHSLRYGWKFVIFAQEQKGFDYYSNLTDFVIHDSDFASGFGTGFQSQYQQITNRKLNIIQLIINLGFNVFLSDADIGFYADPFDELFQG